MNTKQNEAAFADFVKRLVNIAKRRRIGSTTPLNPSRRSSRRTTSVFGIWNDATKPYGVDFITLKGGRLIRDGMLENKNVTTRTGVVPCIDSQSGHGR